jgi:shikimate dehydrogenase
VNTVVNDHGKLTGYNTDANGILETLLPFKEKISGTKVSVIGAGGSARAVIYTLLRHFKPEEINIINRTQQKADTLMNYFSLKMRYDSFHTYELFPPDNLDILADSKLIVNATTIGMFPDVEDSITDIEESFNEDQIVFDLIYNPTKTNFLKMAEQQGAKVVGGLKMLISQAAKSFELWTGSEMPVNEISQQLERYILDSSGM